MRRAREDRRLFRGSERSRLLTLCLMLVMLCVLIPMVRNRTEWFEWFVAQPKGPAPAGVQGDNQPAGQPLDDGAKTAEQGTPAKTDEAKTGAAKTGDAKTGESKTDAAKTGPLASPEKTRVAPPAKSPAEPPKSLADAPQPAPLAGDELEEARLKELLSVVQDGTLKLNEREMPAYFHLIKKANSQKLDVLQAQADHDPKFNNFHQFAAEHRGDLVQIELNVRRIERIEIPFENPADLKEAYELWGWTRQAKAWLYVGVTSELPAGLKLGDVEERVTLVGYFLKMQGYHAGDAKTGARPMVAPLIIGRVIWRPAPPPAKEPWWMWLMLSGVALVIVGFFTVRIMGSLRRRPVSSAAGQDRPAPIGDWLPSGSGPADEPKTAEPGDKPA